MFKTKTEVVNLNVFNMITRISEAKISTKHILCDWKCKFGGKIGIIEIGIKISADVSVKIQ